MSLDPLPSGLKLSLEWKLLEVSSQLLDNVTTDAMAEAKEWFQPHHYLDIIEERTVDGKCGWPLCCKILENAVTEDKVYRVSMKTHKIFDIDQSKYYCSKDCMLQSTYYREALSNSNPLSRPIAKSLAPIDSVGGIESLLSTLAPKMKINYENEKMKSTDYDSDNDQADDISKTDNANVVEVSDINPPVYQNSNITSTGEVKKAIIPNLHVTKITDNSKSILKSVKEVVDPPILNNDITDGSSDYSGAPMKLKTNIKPINMPMPKSSNSESLRTNASQVTKSSTPTQTKNAVSTPSPDMKNKKNANDKKEAKVKFINKYNFEKPSPPHPTTVETFVPKIEFNTNSTKNTDIKESNSKDIAPVVPERATVQDWSMPVMSVNEFMDNWNRKEKVKFKKGYTQAWDEPKDKMSVDEFNAYQAPSILATSVESKIIETSNEPGIIKDIKQHEGKTIQNNRPYTQYNSPEKESTVISPNESGDDEDLSDLENEEEKYDSNNDDDYTEKNVETNDKTKKNPRYINNEYGINDTSMFLRIWTVLSDLFETDALIASDEFAPEIAMSKLDISSTNDDNQRPIPILDTPHWNARNAMTQLIQRGLISAESIINLKQCFDRDSLHLYDQSKLKLLTSIFYPPSCPSLSTSEWTFIGLLIIDAIYRYRDMKVIGINEWNHMIENGAKTILNTYTKSKTLKEEDLKVLRLFFQMETNKITDNA